MLGARYMTCKTCVLDVDVALGQERLQLCIGALHAGQLGAAHDVTLVSTLRLAKGFEIVRRRESISGVAIQLARKAVLSDSTRDLQLHVRACRPRSFSLDRSCRKTSSPTLLRSARPIQRDRSSEKRPRRAHERLPIFFFPLSRGRAKTCSLVEGLLGEHARQRRTTC